MTLLFLSFASAADPQNVEITYTAQFELDSRGDQLCGLTQLCDCTTTYKGAGTLHEKADDRLTFTGTWKIESNSCSGKLTVWVPQDGKAFHTFRKNGDVLDEWIVHRAATGNTRMTSQMKKNGQYWINELAQPWDAKAWNVVQKDGTTLAAGIKLDGTHTLAIQRR